MAFGKNQTKYKKVIQAILPSAPNGEMNKSNISKLVYFCDTNPELLQKVGRYIQKKAEKGVNRKRYGYVVCCVIIIRELIIGCKQHLIFFSSNATQIIKLLLEQNNNPELQIEATETFVKFASVLEDVSQYHEFEDFINYFINMCKNNSSDANRRRRIRCEGLRGVTSYISILDLIDELDTYISRHREIISTILDNMQYRDQLPSPAPVERRNTQDIENMVIEAPVNVKEVAIESLCDLSRRVDNITVTSLVQTILSYLDSQQKWGDDNFSTECMAAMADSIKPQQYTILLTSYLRHLEAQHPPPVTKEIVNTAVAIVNDSTGSVNMVVSHFIKIMINSIELANRKPPPADVDEQFKLQSAIIEAIGAVSKKLRSNRSKIEIMIHIMNQLRDEHVRPNAGESNVVLLDIIQCVLEVSKTLTDVLPHTMLNDLIQRKLLPLAEHHSSEVRIYVQKIFHSLLLPSKTLETLIHGNLGKADGVEELLLENGTFIRDSLFTGFMINNNHPDNIVVLFKTLVILLFRGRNKELQHSIPLIFRIQRILLKKKVSFRLSSSIHLTIASYLLMVAKLYDLQELDIYINNVLKTRKDKGQSCKYLMFDQTESKLVVKQNKNKYREREKNKEIAYEEINQDFVAERLCEIKSLNQEFSDLPKILKKKYNTITRNDLELPQDEGIDLSPPVKTIALLGSNESVNTNIIDHPKILTFESFRQFAIYDNPTENGNGSQYNGSQISSNGTTRNGSNMNGTLSNLGHHTSSSSPSSSPTMTRNSIANNALLTKDLPYTHVVNSCEENCTKLQKEHDLLMRLVVNDNGENRYDDDEELSSTCTLKMNIQMVLEKVMI